MEQTIFASDLDNTLLFSRRHALEGDLCVELLDGAPQGYMTPDAPGYLARVMERALFIPVTSRSVEQYRRIRFPPPCRPRYAAAANGAILLDGGEIDCRWRQESLEAVRPWREALAEALGTLEAQPLARRYRLVDGLFVFAACDDPGAAVTLSCLLREATPLDVGVTGRKVYFFPPPVNKGAAVDRLRRRFGAGQVICAGDSPIDRPMLGRADVAIVPDRTLLEGLSCGAAAVWQSPDRFPDFVLKETVRRMG